MIVREMEQDVYMVTGSSDKKRVGILNDAHSKAKVKGAESFNLRSYYNTEKIMRQAFERSKQNVKIRYLSGSHRQDH